MRIVVAGATGTIGFELCRQLMAVGHDVIGITRSDGGAQRLTSAGADAVVADVMDRESLLTALNEVTADAVIHQATAITRAPVAHRDLYATNALRDIGTSHLLQAARQVGAARFITQSFLFGYGYRDHGEALITEDAAFGEPERGKFNRHTASMRSNEEQVLSAGDMAGIALRYGIFYGHEPSTLSLVDLVRRRRLVAPRHGGAMSLIHIEDAASAAVAALEHGRAGQAYNIADDHPIGWADYLDMIAAAVGATRLRRVPDGLLRMAPYLGALLTRCRVRLDNGKAKRELGWVPRYATAAEGLDAVVRRLESGSG